MSLVRMHNFSVSLDGFGTGEGQQLDAPFGHAGSRLMEWAFETRTFREMGLHGTTAGSRGVDEAFASQWSPGIGVEIMGRNKFGPIRGPWADEEWKGWWGDDPVFHTPVIVLTHHPRPPLEMAGERITIIDCMDDPLLPRAVQEDVVRRYPGARHVRLDSGGHYPYIVRTADYVAVLRQALGVA